MVRTDRREFLEFSGTLLGGIAVGSRVTAAARTDRFITETRGKRVPRDLEVAHEMPGVRFVVVEARERELEKSKTVRDYAPDVEVELDDPDANAAAPTVEQSSIADEPGYGLQWDKQDLDIGRAHETTKGEDTRVTIIDSGVANGHPDLDVNVNLSRNFTGDGLGFANPAGGYHGTHVGGIVGALDNGAGVIGTAPETELVDCRVFGPGPSASFADILAAVVYSANINADAANLSIGAYPIARNSDDFRRFYGKVLNSTMTYANRKGTLLVVAAGNDGADLQHDGNLISLPNEGAQALSVAATGPVGFTWDASEYGGEEPPRSPAVYTNYGTNAVDLAAPGGDYSLEAYEEANDDDVTLPWYLDLVYNTVAFPMYGTDDGGNVTGIEDVVYDYNWVAGTSMAAPQVAGAAALVKSVNRNYNTNQVESALRRAAEIPEGYDRAYYGSGYLNVLDTL